jgi:uncharacterized ion transporter superfamily protein YfcC
MKRFPNPLVLLFIGVILAGLLTQVLPAGEFQRQEDPATGREAVVHGSYHRVQSHPVGPFGTMIALPRGMMEAGEVDLTRFRGRLVVSRRDGRGSNRC